MRKIEKRKRVKDITECKAVEERYRILFEYSRDAIMTLEPPEWKFTSGNFATVKMFKTKNEKDFIVKAPWQYSPKLQPDGKPSGEKAKTMINTAMRKGSSFFEWRHKRLNGEEFPATVLLTRVVIGKNKFLQATVRDISERKKVEQKLKQATEEWRNTFDSITDLVFIQDKNFTIIKANKALIKSLKLKPEQIIGKKCFEVLHKKSEP